MAGKSKRKALGVNWADAYGVPLDEIKPNKAAKKNKPSQKTKSEKVKSVQSKEIKSAPKVPVTTVKTETTKAVKEKKVRAVFYLPENLLQEARNSVVHLAGYPEYLNLTKLAENAITNELKKLKKKHMDGKDFPIVINGPLKGGRPVGS